LARVVPATFAARTCQWYFVFGDRALSTTLVAVPTLVHAVSQVALFVASTQYS
jgi:hypothetical protein